MASASRIPFATLSLLAGLLSLSAAAGFDTGTTSSGNCSGLDNKNFGAFNATGSIKQSEFLSKESPPKEWTWHTGLVAPASNITEARQLFWVDTGKDSVNLNAPNVPYRTCLKVYTQLDNSVYKKALNDNGNCEDIIGKNCLDALRAEISAPNDDESACTTAFDFFVPDECQALKTSAAVGMELTRPSNSTNSTNGCDSTVDNPDGKNTVFLTTGLENTEAKDFELYDNMAKRAYFMIAVPLQRENGNIKSETRFMCLGNTEFAQGSRNPLQTQQSSGSQPQPHPTDKPGAASINGVGMAGSLVAAVIVLMAFFG